MDLLSAKREAQELSRKEKRTKYIIVSEDGECSVSAAPLSGAIAAYSKGSEVALPPIAESKKEENQSKLGKKTKANPKPAIEETKTNNTMATKTKTKVAAKKSAKKSALAKTAKSKTGFDKANKATWGKKVDVTIKAMRDGLKKGFIYRDPQGVKQTEEYLAGRANQNFVRQGMYLSGPF